MFNSIQPRKQRKDRYNAPLHARKQLMHVHLSKELRAKLGITRRSMLVHKGDKVRLRVGTETGKIGAVMRADYNRLKVFVEGFVNKTARGVEKLKALEPANLEIMDGDFAKKDRAEIIARGKKKTGMSTAAKTNMPPAAKTNMPAAQKPANATNTPAAPATKTN